MRSFKTRSMTRGLAVLMLGALTSLALACGGGGGGGGGGVIPNTGCAAFTAAAAPAAGTVVLQNTANSTCNLVVVDVVITDVTDVFTASFDMNYNAAHLRYEPGPRPLVMAATPATAANRRPARGRRAGEDRVSDHWR